MKKIIAFIKKETVFSIALLLGALSMFLVTPSKAYWVQISAELTVCFTND